MTYFSKNWNFIKQINIEWDSLPVGFRSVGKEPQRRSWVGLRCGVGSGTLRFPQLINMVNLFSFLGTPDLHSMFVISVFRTGRHCGGEAGSECWEASYCQVRHASRSGQEDLLSSLPYAWWALSQLHTYLRGSRPFSFISGLLPWCVPFTSW